MVQLKAVQGVIAEIEKYREDDNCTLVFNIVSHSGFNEITRFVITPDTYAIDQETLKVGDSVTAWYDANRPVILIYPPQYEAVAIGRNHPGLMLKGDFFNSQLISSDGMLQLIPAPETVITQTNGQIYPGNPANHNLIVIYGPSTKSIPAQTTPQRIIVFCKQM
ncbi:hypothetical protein QR721_13055 [Aciduricibacillus chroicocephali]|uniref:Gp5/Type VI secretion system Vgr protein OB-fold domain-containing protein n=1 Tax=Aciduricibacillus chroicocephali TaxID=3054939 RepID=A0ABY9KUN7_9BACI|nr:hypothetical protein QR721_13055 [Bacillaceae bacterium 44XB]